MTSALVRAHAELRTIPIAAVLISIPATLLLANLIAYLPGRAAARVGAATVHRTE